MGELSHADIWEIVWIDQEKWGSILLYSPGNPKPVDRRDRVLKVLFESPGICRASRGRYTSGGGVAVGSKIDGRNRLSELLGSPIQDGRCVFSAAALVFLT
jgi:hypothetical protein